MVNTIGKSVYGCTKYKGESENDPNYDIIDFIPYTNMKENEITIEIPDNMVVDWEESKKQNKIVLKDKQLTYEDICRKLFKNNAYYSMSVNIKATCAIVDGMTDPNNATTEHQLECILAKNKLANVATCLNNGWKPKSEDIVTGLMLEGENSDIIFPIYGWYVSKCYLPQFAFKSTELAQQAVEILGEETVKLALEPLGI